MSNISLHKVQKDESFFNLIPDQISYAGYSPRRGFYRRIEFYSGEVLWFLENGKLVEQDQGSNIYQNLEKEYHLHHKD